MMFYVDNVKEISLARYLKWIMIANVLESYAWSSGKCMQKSSGLTAPQNEGR